MLIEPKNKNVVTIMVHVLVWGIVLNLPLLSSDHAPHTGSEYLLGWMPVLASALVFYGNFFYFIPQLLFTRKTWLFFVGNIIFYAVMIVVLEQIRIWIISPTPHTDHQPPAMYDVIGRFFISFALITGVSVAIRITGLWFQSEERRKEVENESLQSELLNLKNQLNPHFLFNTLNNIYSLIAQNQEKAQDTVHQLSKLMRYLMYDSNERSVPLSKEIEFMHHYIDLMKLRLGSNVSVEYVFQRDVAGVMIAPLLFISLIENAFKHGVHSSQPSSISMRLTVDSSKKVNFFVSNTSFPKKDNDRSGSGIGLQNLQKRLSLIYTNTHQLLMEEKDGYFNCTLTIQL